MLTRLNIFKIAFFLLLLSGLGACVGKTDMGTGNSASSKVRLNVIIDGDGSGKVSVGDAVQCETSCENEVDSAEVLNIQAIAADGSVFGAWQGSCSGSETICSVDGSKDVSLTAIFDKAPPQEIDLNIVIEGNGKGVVSGDQNIECSQSCIVKIVDDNWPLTLKAIPQMGHDFVGWQGGCTGAQSTCMLTENSPTEIKAVFATAGASLSGLVLMNADTGMPVDGFNPIGDGAIINLSLVPSRNLTVVAESLANVMSVKFGLNGNPEHRVENIAPFALESDQVGGMLVPWSLGLGKHFLSATPYAEPKAAGQAGESIEINFEIVELKLAASQNDLSFTSVVNRPAPSSQKVTLSNDGNITGEFSVSGVPEWLSVEPLNGRVQAGQSVDLNFSASACSEVVNQSASLLVDAGEVIAVPIRVDRNCSSNEARYDYTINRFYFNQAVPAMDSNKALNQQIYTVEKRPGLARAFITASENGAPVPVVNLVWKNAAGETGVIPMTPPSRMRTSLNEGIPGHTYNSVLDADFFSQGREFYIEIDPDNSVPETNENNNRYPSKNSVVPVQSSGDQCNTSAQCKTIYGNRATDCKDSASNQSVCMCGNQACESPTNSGASADGFLPLKLARVPKHNATFVRVITQGQEPKINKQQLEQLYVATRKLNPLADFDLQIRNQPYTFKKPRDYDKQPADRRPSLWSLVLGQVNQLRIADGSNRYYHGLVVNGPVPGSRTAGIGYVGQRAAVSRMRAGTIAHEFGHNFGLSHTPCGQVANPDPNYPHNRGVVNIHGYDIYERTLKAPTQPDFMSYCPNEWVSDYSYRKVMNSRGGTVLSNGARQKTNFQSTEPETVLMVSGYVKNEKFYFSSIFELDAIVENSPGEYNLSGFNKLGEEQFNIPFALNKIDHLDNEYHFNILVPIADLNGALAKLQIKNKDEVLLEKTQSVSSGLQKSSNEKFAQATRVSDNEVEVSWDSSRFEQVIVRDNETQNVLSIDGSGQVLVISQASSLVLIYSDGLSSFKEEIAVKP